MRTVAVMIDGVLRKPLDVEAQDFGATLLYQGLLQGFRVLVLGGYNTERDTQFMAINGMGKYIRIEPLREEDAPEERDRIVAQIKRLRAEGFQFEFVVVPDPDLAKDLYRIGVPVLLYLHPHYSAEAFRPDFQGGIKPWAELSAEAAYQREAKVKQILEQADR